jgi:uncharacterized protein (DUF58 family)
MMARRGSRLAFLAILFVVAALLRLDFLFIVFYLFALVYLLSHFWVRATSRTLELERRLTDHAFSGDLVRVRLQLVNRGRLPVPWLDLHESLPVQLATPPFFRNVFGLAARSHRVLEYELHCAQRGYYEIGPLTVRTGDLLGFARPRMVQLAPQPLIVYPKVFPLERLGVPTYSPQVSLPARSPLFLDPSRVMGVRDYQRGDSPRRIHWTATAKASARALTTLLMVKQYQPAISRETLICLDLNRQDYGRRNWAIATERAIVVAASLANHIVVREQLSVGLVVEARDPRAGADGGPTRAPPTRAPPTRAPRAVVRVTLPPRTGRGHLMRLLEVLAWAQVVDAVPAAGEGVEDGIALGLAGLLRETAKGLSWGTTLVIVTGKESPELLDTIFYLQRAGFAVALVLVRPGRAPDGGFAAARARVPVYRVWEESEAGGVLGQISAARAARPYRAGAGA